jgi:hypothetical protein
MCLGLGLIIPLKTSKKHTNIISILFFRKKGCKVGNPTYFHLEHSYYSYLNFFCKHWILCTYTSPKPIYCPKQNKNSIILYQNNIVQVVNGAILNCLHKAPPTQEQSALCKYTFPPSSSSFYVLKRPSFSLVSFLKNH